MAAEEDVHLSYQLLKTPCSSVPHSSEVYIQMNVWYSGKLNLNLHHFLLLLEVTFFFMCNTTITS